MILRNHLATTALGTSLALSQLSLGETLDVPADYATIQSCIDAAVSGADECVVAPGTYHETINFLGKAITLRSSGGADVTTIDATGLGGSVVTCANSEGPDTILEGFTITGGTETYDWWRERFLGGGMYCYLSNPTVTNCTFDRNMGSGLFNDVSSPTVTDCTFSANRASQGGGMFNNRRDPTVSNCTFSGNTGYNGGGMFNLFSSPIVTNCLFDGNTAETGAGMWNYSRSPTVLNCTFRGNTAYTGGGMFNVDNSNPTVANCTFSGNLAAYGGGMYNWYYSNPVATNCVFWNASSDEILNVQLSTIEIGFSIVQGGLPVGTVDGGGNIDMDPMFVRSPDPGPDGAWDGVHDDYGDLRLQAGSPCINTGDPAFVAQPGETDLEGHARVLCGRVDMGGYEFGIGDYDCNQVLNLADFAAWPACMTGPQLSDEATEPRSHEETIQNRQLAIGNRQMEIGNPCAAFDFDADSDVDLFDFSEMQRIFAGP